MFKNSKAALLFVGMTLLSVIILVGWEDNEGALLKAASDIEKQRSMMNAELDGPNAETGVAGFAPRDPRLQTFTPDEELIDQASGYDPTPKSDTRAAPSEPRITVVESSAEITYQ